MIKLSILILLTIIQSCHYNGKLLPIRWQSLANTVAKVCHRDGKNSVIHTLKKKDE